MTAVDAGSATWRARWSAEGSHCRVVALVGQTPGDSVALAGHAAALAALARPGLTVRALVHPDAAGLRALEAAAEQAGLTGTAGLVVQEPALLSDPALLDAADLLMPLRPALPRLRHCATPRVVVPEGAARVERRAASALIAALDATANDGTV